MNLKSKSDTLTARLVARLRSRPAGLAAKRLAGTVETHHPEHPARSKAMELVEELLAKCPLATKTKKGVWVYVEPPKTTESELDAIAFANQQAMGGIKPAGPPSKIRAPRLPVKVKICRKSTIAQPPEEWWRPSLCQMDVGWSGDWERTSIPEDADDFWNVLPDDPALCEAIVRAHLERCGHKTTSHNMSAFVMAREAYLPDGITYTEMVPPKPGTLAWFHDSKHGDAIATHPDILPLLTPRAQRAVREHYGLE